VGTGSPAKNMRQRKNPGRDKASLSKAIRKDDWTTSGRSGALRAISLGQKPMTLDTGLSVRHAARSRALDAPTSGLAYGYVQGNLAILPRDFAEDFLRSAYRRSAIRRSPRSAPTSISAPTFRATGCGATVSWSTSRATSDRSGATIW